MANSFPADYVAPDPGKYPPGEAILEPEVEYILGAANYLHAMPVPMVAQMWNPADNPCRRTATMPAMPAALAYGTSVAVWRIPQLGVRTDVVATVRCLRDGASGSVRFRSVITDNQVTVAAGGTVGFLTSAALTCDFASLGYDDVEMYIAGTGAADTDVYAVTIEYAPLTSPLAAPASTDPFVPFDDEEADDDEPLASDLMNRLRDDTLHLLTRLRGYFSWSGLRNTSAGAAASHEMPAWAHSRLVPVYRGTREQALKLTVWVRAENTDGAVDQHVVLNFGGNPRDGAGRDVHARDSDGDHRLTITIPAATGSPTWFDGEIEMPESLAFEASGVPFPVIRVVVWPGDADATVQTSAALYSVSAWGV